MNGRTWLAVMAVAGIGLFALGFVDGWLVHDRELRGADAHQQGDDGAPSSPCWWASAPRWRGPGERWCRAGC